MINPKEQPVEWSLWFDELIDASEHLSKLVDEIKTRDDLDSDFDCELSIDLGHIYSHLNRAWNSRKHIGEINTED